jgi:hypothetical protein
MIFDTNFEDQNLNLYDAFHFPNLSIITLYWESQ